MYEHLLQKKLPVLVMVAISGHLYHRKPDCELPKVRKVKHQWEKHIKLNSEKASYMTLYMLHTCTGYQVEVYV